MSAAGVTMARMDANPLLIEAVAAPTVRAQPLSLEEMLTRKREQEAAEVKVRACPACACTDGRLTRSKQPN